MLQLKAAHCLVFYMATGLMDRLAGRLVTGAQSGHLVMMHIFSAVLPHANHRIQDRRGVQFES